jgi:hypothetical protein
VFTTAKRRVAKRSSAPSPAPGGSRRPAARSPDSAPGDVDRHTCKAHRSREYATHEFQRLVQVPRMARICDGQIKFSAAPTNSTELLEATRVDPPPGPQRGASTASSDPQRALYTRRLPPAAPRPRASFDDALHRAARAPICVTRHAVGGRRDVGGRCIARLKSSPRLGLRLRVGSGARLGSGPYP